MRIVVLIKYVPDSAVELGFAPDHTVNRAAVGGHLSELDEYAVEQALQVADTLNGEVLYLTMGPQQAADALRKALSMGGDAAYHVVDDALHGSDALATSLVLARALQRISIESAYDLVICGMASTDAGMSVVPAMVAERLGLAGLTMAAELRVEGDTVTIRRDSDDASITVTAALPALVSVTDRTGEARYPSFKGIMAAKKKPITTWHLADLEIEPEAVGHSAALSVVAGITRRPSPQSGTVIRDEGDGGVQLADFLTARKFI